MLDGAAKIDALFAEAKRLGMPALAVTDHGNMFGAAEFYRASQKYGITPIIGIEAYVAPGSRRHKKPVFWGRTNQRGTDEYGEGGDVSGSGAYTHMTLLAKGATGLRNLFKLSSEASFTGFHRKPRCDRELLAEHAEGIIATTGCPSGEVQTRLRLGQHAEAMQAASDFRDIFGPGNLYLELMDHGLPIERSVREGLLNIGRALDLPPLATNDCHYVTRDQAEAHGALLCVQTGRTLDDPKRFKFEGDGYYLKSPTEMRAYWDTEVPGAADNTLRVAARIEPYNEVFASSDRLPRFPVPDGDTQDGYLAELVRVGLARRCPDEVPPRYVQRADYELGIIAAKHYAGYFLVVADVVNWAKSSGIRVGPGRGSAAGSLVVYALGITDVDPIRHGLLFERFLNPERPSMPDIDLDFDDRRRGEVIRYVTQRWGSEHVAQIATFGGIKTKAALKDAARVLHGSQSFAIADRISKALPPAVFAQDVPLAGIFDPGHERYGEAGAFRALVESDPQAARVVQVARGLEGLVRNVGVHASAVILSSQPLVDVIPLWRRDDGSTVTGWEMYACEDVGLLKMDFLGLRNLTMIEDTIADIAATGSAVPDLATLPLDDPAVFDLLARGDTLGVFQLDGRAMRELLVRMKPTCFADISAALALYRPGPMAANAHLDYADRKNGRQPIGSIHPDLAEPLADILDVTHGLIVYQEQILAIAQRVAGYSLGAADLLRKAMGKKKKDVLDREYERFTAGMRDGGYSQDATRALWDLMVPFADYAFNRAHSTSYAMLSYWTAWLKAHYPVAYMAALLTSVGDKKDRCAVYLAECRRMGITVLPPDVNDSRDRFTAVEDGVRFGLSAVRDVGAHAAQSVIDARESRGRYVSFGDFLDKVDLSKVGKRAIDGLIRAGAFDSLGHPRRALAAAAAAAVDGAVNRKRHEAVGQSSLFDSSDDDEVSSPLDLGDDEWPLAELLAYEREALGFYVSAHPLDNAEPTLRRHAPRSIAELMEDPSDGTVTAAGMIGTVTSRMTKQGKPWASVTVEDRDTSIEVQVYAGIYPRVRERLTPGAVVVVTGQLKQREDVVSLVASDIVTLDLTVEPQPVVLRADPPQLSPESVAQLRDALTAHPGDEAVRIVMPYRGEDIALALDDYQVAPGGAFTSALDKVAGVTMLA
jgi:DNA polymerase III subunit alpha